LEILRDKLKFFCGPPWLLTALVVREWRQNLPSGPWVWKCWELLC